jgi:hypothetical protein
MADDPKDLERPTFPWGGLLIGAIAIFLAIGLVNWVLHAILGAVRLAIIVVIAVAIIGLIVSGKGDKK